MICIRAIVKGEPDTPPFTKVFAYGDSCDEELIFRNAVKIVKEKLNQNLRINVNESLLVYAAYVVDQLRSGKSFDLIQRNTTEILMAHQVMIGVPETLRKICFEITLDSKFDRVCIILDRPIPTIII